MSKNLNVWFFLSLIISLFVLIPIITVFSSFFDDTSNYYVILKETFLIEYIINSSILLFFVLLLTFLLGTGTAYLVSFYNFLFILASFCKKETVNMSEAVAVMDII